MLSDKATLIAQLRALLQLTNTEIQIAETRTAQARTDAVRTELMQNADNGRARAAAISQSLRDIGGYPDVLSPLLGRLTALVKAVIEQAEPLEGALLEDLAVEHQLVDRARYVKVLATSIGNADVVELADRLLIAHEATVEWLTVVLAEEALGGPAALRRTPLQAAAGAASKVLNAPATWSAGQVDRVVASAKDTPAKVGNLLNRGAYVKDVAAQTVTASRDAALHTAEEVTRSEGVDAIADTIHKARVKSGALSSEELPIAEYDGLNVSDSVAAIRNLSMPQDVRTVVAFEERNKNRRGVLSAAQAHLASIAHDAAGI